ncbi:MAG: CPBP family intramembrane metalloprotease [Planctomycetales bacterium]|nr:CPBP family intramembrane metalloprotease [Planctomycetales bacterium]
MIVAPLILLAALAVILGFFVCWGLAIAKLVRRQPLLPYEPRRPVPWGLIDLVLVVLVLFGFAQLSVYLLHGLFGLGDGAVKQPLSLQQNMLLIWADIAMKVGAMLITAPIIMLRTGCSWRDMGVVPKEAGRDIAIGLAAFCMLAPIVFAIQAALSQIQPYKHPIIEMLTNTPDVPFFALLTFSAVILAPLSEEWAFRVLLQGWLERMVTHTGNPFHLLVGGIPPAEPMVLDDGVSPQPTDGNAIVPAEEITFLSSVATPQPGVQWIDPANPYSPLQAIVEPLESPYALPLAAAVVPDFAPPSLWKQWLPIYVSSIIFALMHYSHGLAWIPLTFLALGLGYIYQRTHRILPSIVVHFCLNGLSMGAFWVQMFEVPALQGK